MPDFLPVARDSAIYDVKYGGAVGDGRDDSALINALIASTSPGSVIYFSPPPNFYGVGASPLLFLPQRAYIGPSGQWGGGNTLIRQLSGANLPAVIATTDWYNNNAFCGLPLIIKDLIIDGNSANNTTSHGIAFTNFNTTIEECWIVNAPAAGILAAANTRNGNLISNGMVQARINKCTIQSSGTYGISIADSSHGKVTDGYILKNQIDTPTLACVIMDTAGGWRVENNHINSPQQDGIIASHCFNTFVRGNYIDGFGFNASAPPGTFYSGILAQVLAGSRTLVADNIVRSSGVVANTTYQFVNAQATDNTGTNYATVHDNQCYGANSSNQNMFAFDNKNATQQFTVNEWNNAAANFFAAANLYTITNSGGGGLPIFNPLQSQNAVRPNNSSALFSGTGVPAAGLGANGDFYFRTDTPGTANQRMYIKAAGAWSALTI